jgi:hypothetical protein
MDTVGSGILSFSLLSVMCGMKLSSQLVDISMPDLVCLIQASFHRCPEMH